MNPKTTMQQKKNKGQYMSRAKKESVPINARLDKEIVDRLDAYCDEYGVTKTFVLEKALTTYLDKQIEAQRIAKKLTED